MATKASGAATGRTILKLHRYVWICLARRNRSLTESRSLLYRQYSEIASENSRNDGIPPNFNWLNELSHGIPVKGKHVRIYTEPKEYYELLEERAASCCHRMKLSSLYLGTGELEQRLVRRIDDRMSAVKGLSCHFLLDCLRGTRGSPNSCTLLQPLIVKYPQAVRLSLYHTPDFRGLLKRVFPERFNEGMGLQHMKVYIFDNSVIISGANLSETYFTNRQDRCIEISNSPELADFYSLLLDRVCDHSFSVGVDGALLPPPVGINPLSSRSESEQFKLSLKHSVEELIFPSRTARLSSTAPRDSDCDTIVYPLVQMGQIGVRQDQMVTEKLFTSLEEGSSAFLASGYFNMPPTYTDLLVTSPGKWNILAASPEANGFYGAHGIAGRVPSMYVYFANRFLKKTLDQQKKNIKYFEYFRPEWTFHGKGFWLYPRTAKVPVASLVGSSNFGYRSLLHDLETQVLLVTESMALRRALHEECRHLFEYSCHVPYESAVKRKIHSLEKIATLLLTHRV